MKIDWSSGIIEGVKQAPSPNFDCRPSGVRPEALIIHSISLPPGQYGGSEIEELFCNKLDCSAHSYFHALKNLKVSAHLLIRRNGEVIQFVSLNERAWHAGESFCLERENVNDFSIGIELEGCDEDTFEEDQYAALDELIRLLIAEYPQINRSRIFGHSEIAPKRKTDPGPNFEWSRVR